MKGIGSFEFFDVKVASADYETEVLLGGDEILVSFQMHKLQQHYVKSVSFLAAQNFNPGGMNL